MALVNSRRSTAVWLGVLAVSGSFLAGCLGFQRPDRPPEPNEPLTAFSATYTLGPEERWTIGLVGVTGALDAFGQRRDAYQVDYWRNNATDPSLRTLLDGGFRIVRVDYPCIGRSSGECSHHASDWLWWGHLAPGGIGLLPQALQQSELEVRAGSTSTVMDVLWSGAPQEHVVVLTPQGPAPPILLWEASASYSFDEFAWAPERVEWKSGTADGRTLVRESLSLGNALPPVGSWPRPLFDASTPASQHVMFPGEGNDDYGSGYPHKEPLDWLLESDAEAEAMLDDGGCIMRYAHYPQPQGGAATAALGPNSSRFEIGISDLQGAGHVWSVSREPPQSPLAAPEYEITDMADRQYEDACGKSHSAPPAAVESSAFFDFVAQLRLDSQPPAWFTFDIGNRASVPVVPDEGWRGYTMVLIPGFVDLQGGMPQVWTPFRVEVSANRGTLDYWSVSPEDSQRLDEKDLVAAELLRRGHNGD